VIYCALHSLAVEGESLWDEFDNGDNLLFRESDFQNPSNSALLRHLWNADPSVRSIVGQLILASQSELDQVPTADRIPSLHPIPLTAGEIAAVEQILTPRQVRETLSSDRGRLATVSGAMPQSGREIFCTSCSNQLRVPHSAAGKSLMCPKCRGIMRVPENLPNDAPFVILLPDEWYFKRHGVVLGPYSAEQMEHFASTAVILPTDRVLHGGGGGTWRPAESHEWLRTAFGYSS
jgi:hypothetical protein